MIIRPGWQQMLYDFAEDAVVNNRSYKEKYITAYEKMRDIGVNNYQIEDMDVTIISTIITFSNRIHNIARTEDATRNAMNQLRMDRNLSGHTNGNEDPEELYLQGLLDLVNLRNFVRTVDISETNISNTERLAFRNQYIPKIEDLKSVMDEERFVLVHKSKEFDRDIQKVLDSEDQQSTWGKIFLKYAQRYVIDPEPSEKDLETLHEFEMRASDKGIRFAHCRTADHMIHMKKDFEEAERRLLMLYDSEGNLPDSEFREIINVINYWVMYEHPLSSNLEKMIEDIKTQGHIVIRNPDGYFIYSGQMS